MKIFYAWQTDTPSKIGKAFIRQALDEAVEILAESLELEEADRPTVDQDTQGVMGDPVIAETIFEKIRDARVVVADVTLTGATPDGKKLINSNVVYELGYAHGFHGDSVILKVMNNSYGTPDELPFDLRHRRWPVQYDVDLSATKSARRAVRKELAKELAQILQNYLESVDPVAPYEPIPATANAAVFWDEGEVLVTEDRHMERDAALNLDFPEDQPLVFLRVWPDNPMQDLSGRALGDFTISSIHPLLDRATGYSYCRNRFGTITYAPTQSDDIKVITQLFKNREIWGVDSFLLRPREGHDFGIIADMSLATGIIRSLHTYAKKAFDELVYPDGAHVQCGLINIRNYKIALPNDVFYERFSGPIFEDVVVTSTLNKDDPNSWNAFALMFFERVFDAAGMDRPANLYGIPAPIQ